MCLSLPLLSIAIDNSKYHTGYFAKFGDYSYIDACEVQLGVSPSSLSCLQARDVVAQARWPCEALLLLLEAATQATQTLERKATISVTQTPTAVSPGLFIPVTGLTVFTAVFELCRCDFLPQRLRRECIFDLLQHQKHAVLHGSPGSLQRLHHPPLHTAQACGLANQSLNPSLADCLSCYSWSPPSPSAADPLPRIAGRCPAPTSSSLTTLRVEAFQTSGPARLVLRSFHLHHCYNLTFCWYQAWQESVVAPYVDNVLPNAKLTPPSDQVSTWRTSCS
jgi:hypothetical protein